VSEASSGKQDPPDGYSEKARGATMAVLVMAIAFIAYVVLVLGSTGSLAVKRLNPFAGAGVLTYDVRVTGTRDSTCGAHVTITCGGECDTMTIPYVEGSWSEHVRMRPGDPIFISAQILCQGSLKVRVLKADVVYREAIVAGDFVTATLDGRY
jgi:hypothetical protein